MDTYRQTYKTPSNSSPSLPQPSSSHHRGLLINDFANISFQNEPPSSNQAVVLFSQLAPSQPIFNFSLYSSPTLAIGDVGAQREDNEVSIPDMDAGDWSEPEPVEYADGDASIPDTETGSFDEKN